MVDKNDKILGFEEKYKAHKVPVPLHRAISIVIFNKSRQKTLITKRSAKKPTWPLFWSNTVCSHPYPNESYQEAAERRIFEEAGFRTKLAEAFRFTYKAKMSRKAGSGFARDNRVWGEHEYDVVFTGSYGGLVNPNPDEIADYKWVEIKKLKKDINKNPQEYTPWLKILLRKLKI